MVKEPLLETGDGELHLAAHPRLGAQERKCDVAAPAEQAAFGLEERAEHLGEDAEIA